MQNGEYIVNRLLPAMVANTCAAQTIAVQKYSDDWVMRLSKDDVTRWVFGYKFDLNNAAAAHIAQDKVATYQTLAAANIPVVPHVLARSVSGNSDTDLSRTLGSQRVVIKPLIGTGGRGVELYDNVTEALQAIQQTAETAWAFSPYQEIAAEYRIVLLDGQVLVAYEKTHPLLKNGLKYFNLGLGAQAEDIEPDDLDPLLTDLAHKSVSAVCLRLAAVDIVRLADNTFAVIEINDGISMEHYALQSQAHKNSAAQVYDAIVRAMFTV